MNVTGADNIEWRSIDICRVSSDCATIRTTRIAGDTNLTNNLGDSGDDECSPNCSFNSTGVKTVTMSGAASSEGASTDLFLVTIGCTENLAHGNASPDFTVNQNLDTPLGGGAPNGVVIMVGEDKKKAMPASPGMFQVEFIPAED
jgi:hypothetical protein